MTPEQSQAFKSLGEDNDALQKCDERKVRGISAIYYCLWLAEGFLPGTG